MKNELKTNDTIAGMSTKKLAHLIKTLREGDGLSRERAQEALIASANPMVVEQVAPLLEASDTGTRMMVLEILKKTGNNNIEAIIRLLDHENEDVRVYACEIITCLKNPSTIPFLIRKTKGDADNVRNSACIGLGEFDDEGAVDALLEALKDDDWVTFSAIFSLGTIGNRRAIPALFDVFKNGSDEISLAACETLIDFREPGVLDDVIETLKGWDEKKRDDYMKVMLEKGEEDVFFRMKDLIGDELLGHLLGSTAYGKRRSVPILRLLAHFKTPAACDAILEAAAELDSEAEEYGDILECLVELKDVWSGSLNDYISKGEQYFSPLIKACGIGGVRIDEALLIDAFLSAPVEARRDIIQNIENIVGGTGYGIVSKAIRDADSHVRGLAVARAGRMGFAALIDEIKEMAMNGFSDVRSKALKSLIQLNPAEAMVLVDRFVNHGSPEDKKVFLAAAHALDKERNYPYLTKLLKDRDEGIQRATITVFGNFLEDERYMTILADLLKDRDIPHEALKVVKEKKLTAFRDRLISLFTDHNQGTWTRYYALSALDGFKDRSLFDLFLAGLEDEESLIRIGSVNALSDLEDPRALLHIVPFTESEDEDIRSSAEAAVSRLENL
ncbi:MAG TPA: HEAT repeat domain-containing protein [Syntrophorhabdaceae bacterium]|jgi:HEAT repeat protein